MRSGSVPEFRLFLQEDLHVDWLRENANMVEQFIDDVDSVREKADIAEREERTGRREEQRREEERKEKR